MFSSVHLYMLVMSTSTTALLKQGQLVGYGLIVMSFVAAGIASLFFKEKKVDRKSKLFEKSDGEVDD